MGNEDFSLVRSRLAALESQIDLLLAERSHLDAMLIKCGFAQGIRTLMQTVEEVLQDGGIDAYGEGNSLASPDN